MKPGGSAGKRVFDVVVAAVALILLSPVILLTAAAIRLRLGSPVLFTQLRPGLHGKPFTLYKFRTMRPGVDSSGRPLPDSQRVTPLGRFLRSSSLDELPELYNVLKGDMSVVGPRPLLMEYLPRYSSEQARRHDVRPGLTGLAQVSGRNALSWEDKFRLDVEYVDRRSMPLDLRILWWTVGKVLSREGISPVEQEDVIPFRGSAASSGGR